MRKVIGWVLSVLGVVVFILGMILTNSEQYQLEASFGRAYGRNTMEEIVMMIIIGVILAAVGAIILLSSKKGIQGTKIVTMNKKVIALCLLIGIVVGGVIANSNSASKKEAVRIMESMSKTYNSPKYSMGAEMARSEIKNNFIISCVIGGTVGILFGIVIGKLSNRKTRKKQATAINISDTNYYNNIDKSLNGNKIPTTHVKLLKPIPKYIALSLVSLAVISLFYLYIIIQCVIGGDYVGVLLNPYLFDMLTIINIILFITSLFTTSVTYQSKHIAFIVVASVLKSLIALGYGESFEAVIAVFISALFTVIYFSLQGKSLNSIFKGFYFSYIIVCLIFIGTTLIELQSVLSSRIEIIVGIFYKALMILVLYNPISKELYDFKILKDNTSINPIKLSNDKKKLRLKFNKKTVFTICIVVFLIVITSSTVYFNGYRPERNIPESYKIEEAYKNKDFITFDNRANINKSSLDRFINNIKDKKEDRLTIVEYGISTDKKAINFDTPQSIIKLYYNGRHIFMASYSKNDGNGLQLMLKGKYSSIVTKDGKGSNSQDVPFSIYTDYTLDNGNQTVNFIRTFTVNRLEPNMTEGLIKRLNQIDGIDLMSIDLVKQLKIEKDIMGTWSGKNEFKERITFQFNEDYTFRLTGETNKLPVSGQFNIALKDNHGFMWFVDKNGKYIAQIPKIDFVDSNLADFTDEFGDVKTLSKRDVYNSLNNTDNNMASKNSSEVARKAVNDPNIYSIGDKVNIDGLIFRVKGVSSEKTSNPNEFLQIVKIEVSGDGLTPIDMARLTDSSRKVYSMDLASTINKNIALSGFNISNQYTLINTKNGSSKEGYLVFKTNFSSTDGCILNLYVLNGFEPDTAMVRLSESAKTTVNSSGTQSNSENRANGTQSTQSTQNSQVAQGQAIKPDSQTSAKPQNDKTSTNTVGGSNNTSNTGGIDTALKLLKEKAKLPSNAKLYYDDKPKVVTYSLGVPQEVIGKECFRIGVGYEDGTSGPEYYVDLTSKVIYENIQGNWEAIK